MAIITKLYEYVKYALLPKYLRNKNLIYHATIYECFLNIIEHNFISGMNDYEISRISTSRNKHYAFGRDDYEGYHGHNLGDVQFILDRDLIAHKYKVSAFDWEEYKRITSKTGEYSDDHQSEDRILTDEIVNIDKYIIGFQIIHDKFTEKLRKEKLLCSKIVMFNWVVFDEDWNDITNTFI